MNWRMHAAALAADIAHPGSVWWDPLRRTPRHLLVPAWFTPSGHGWKAVNGPAGDEAWAAAAYSNRTLVTKVGPVHADGADPEAIVVGHPTSSSTEPELVVTMLRHAHLAPGLRLLDLATGSGYSAALACHRLGDDRLVTSVDVDPYLTKVAAERLDTIGRHPEVVTADGTGDLPGVYDRIVSMVSVPRIPAGWLAALAPGGRLVTTITDTGLIITANRTEDGGASGRVEWDRGSFMATRTGADYPPALNSLFTQAADEDGETTVSPLPVLDVMQGWDVWSMLSLLAPGIEHRTGTGVGGSRMTWMLHPDGSWARATTEPGERTSAVHQGGRRRLYDLLEQIRWWWIEHGDLPAHGAEVTITPDGETTLRRGGWSVTL
ncbi:MULTISPECIES: protein-L-isoaspartate(D-aspartate) O-methyltransferase [Streptomyces]|uniref:protein-L-isoaspartate(D-aspartate) O-methyltransferase n=1 Tax=Streptomyces TaxID=1883 RepID=UPI0006FCBBB3|nr:MULTISPECIES: protein-L-isoaspartate(D-aspartate) O-methyltransferase [unclassified Streptomyces]KQZ17674.1 protein-L-isoaspartate(D-aspartate) O-methyltransferase [Streptomyces sp. Root55]RPK71525.1 Protein-L-isoaspartate O-methyltransferase [Streptomyces sp. ADI97-07]